MIPLLATLLACGLGGGTEAYTGTIEVTEVEAAATVAGRLVQVVPREGDAVHRGDLLFQVDPTRIEAEVALREAGLAEAEAAREAAEAQVRAARAQVRTLERELNRVVALAADGVATDQQRSQLEGQLQVARAQAAAARELVAQAAAAGDQARAGLDASRAALAETEVAAALDAVVLSRNREPGEVVGPGMSVLTLGDLERPRLRVYVPLVQAEALHLGDAAQIHLDAGQRAEGHVARIASEAEFTPRDILTPDERVKRVFAVDIDVVPGPGVHPGMPAEAVFAGR